MLATADDYSLMWQHLDTLLGLMQSDICQCHYSGMSPTELQNPSTIATLVYLL